jgi:predicted transcriptional regulator
MPQVHSTSRPNATGNRRSAKPTRPRRTKATTILALLSRKTGARMADLERATGWQSHSIRAALTVLRRQGYSVIRETNTRGVSRYRVSAGAKR